MHDFFIVCPLNLEKEVCKELKTKWKIYNPDTILEEKVLKGGIALKTELEKGLCLNYYLRSANRILLRIKEQKCRDLPKLYKIISKIEWKKYLVKEEASFHISAHKSRLIHTKKIEKTACEALSKYFNANKIKQSIKEKYAHTSNAQIYIRLDNDELSISLDTTGEHLYKRDNIAFKGLAPLRNNLAFIMLEKLIHETKIGLEDYTLIDPMCGSGTFIHEAQNRSKLIKRKFYFENVFNVQKLQEYKQGQFKDFMAFDINEKIISNLSIKAQVQDLFQGDKQDIKSITVLNPPYGKKVKITGSRNNFFDQIIVRVFEKFNSDYLGIIIPEGVKVKFSATKELKIFNNGIWVKFAIYAKENN